MQVINCLGSYVATQRNNLGEGGYIGIGKTRSEAIRKCMQVITDDIAHMMATRQIIPAKRQMSFLSMLNPLQLFVK